MESRNDTVLDVFERSLENENDFGPQTEIDLQRTQIIKKKALQDLSPYQLKEEAEKDRIEQDENIKFQTAESGNIKNDNLNQKSMEMDESKNKINE